MSRWEDAFEQGRSDAERANAERKVATSLPEQEFASTFQYHIRQSNLETATGTGLDAIAKKYGLTRDQGQHGRYAGTRYAGPETDTEFYERIKEAKEHTK